MFNRNKHRYANTYLQPLPTTPYDDEMAEVPLSYREMLMLNTLIRDMCEPMTMRLLNDPTPTNRAIITEMVESLMFVGHKFNAQLHRIMHEGEQHGC